MLTLPNRDTPPPSHGYNQIQTYSNTQRSFPTPHRPTHLPIQKQLHRHTHSQQQAHPNPPTLTFRYIHKATEHTHSNRHIETHTHIHTHRATDTLKPTLTQIHTHTYTHTARHAQTYTHIHAHIHRATDTPRPTPTLTEFHTHSPTLTPCRHTYLTNITNVTDPFTPQLQPHIPGFYSNPPQTQTPDIEQCMPVYTPSQRDKDPETPSVWIPSQKTSLHTHRYTLRHTSTLIHFPGPASTVRRG